MRNAPFRISNDHIGLNAPASERFTWRYVLHCAPLQTNHYTSYGFRGNNNVVRYHYGTRTANHNQGSRTEDHILEKDDVNTQYSVGAEDPTRSSNLSFELTALRSRRVNGQVDPESDFRPIAELERADGDLVIIFLSGNGVLFLQALDDDWYQATVPIATAGSKSALKYRPLNAASPMGCVQQMQWCNSTHPGDRSCGPLASAYDAFLGAAPFFNLTSDEVYGVNSLRPFASQAAGARLIWAALAVFNSPAPLLDVVVTSLGSRALISRFQSNNGIQLPIPINQWQDDVRHWCDTALASVQAMFKQATAVSFSQAPFTEEEIKMCQSQKYRSGDYTSFSVFGISFIIIFGVIIIIISYALEPYFACLSRRHKDRQYAHLEWITNEALQLHRLAHEEHSESTWLRCDQDVPINDTEALLPSLDISDPEHPILA
ncbi:hypothetical protein NUW58_g2967 [Xylaria curta]|uniref:Uncharacterized protein n=1 Tax=Xylaria curta TaxID=42375 RepID=A0ACC1PFG7_9PEZI|nr:hypothetical protein NUW58_g2967 [Xylaria curta]